jgi:hypothetical protein
MTTLQLVGSGVTLFAAALTCLLFVALMSPDPALRARAERLLAIVFRAQ